MASIANASIAVSHVQAVFSTIGLWTLIPVDEARITAVWLWRLRIDAHPALASARIRNARRGGLGWNIRRRW